MYVVTVKQADHELSLICVIDQQAIETLLRLAEEYAGHGKNFGQQGQESAKGAHDQDGLKKAEADLRVYLYRTVETRSAFAD